MFVDQPWDDADSASLYDAFPFTEDWRFTPGWPAHRVALSSSWDAAADASWYRLPGGDGPVAAAVEVGAVAGAFDVPAGMV